VPGTIIRMRVVICIKVNLTFFFKTNDKGIFYFKISKKNQKYYILLKSAFRLILLTEDLMDKIFKQN